MATLILDIATVGQPWGALDTHARHALTRFDDAATAEAKLALSPLTGSIAALGLYDLERRQGVVYVAAPGATIAPQYKTCSEAELLEDFWEGAQSYDVFVTFGGRRFDLPFLLHRSAVYGVRPTRDLPRSRYLDRQRGPYHVDLCDEFSRSGDLRAPVSLHLLAHAYGFKSPDAGPVTGESVGRCFQEERFTDLATYVEQTVETTTALYDRWRTHFAPPSFLNVVV